MAGKAAGKEQRRSRPQGQRRERQGKSSPDAGGTARRAGANGSNARREQNRPRNPDEDQQQPSGPVSRVADTVKQHPVTAAAIGAGLTLLAARGLRMAIGGNGGQEAEDQEQEDEPQRDDDPEASIDSGEGEEGEENEDEQRRGLTGRLRQGARSGFERGRQAAGEGWQNHPLVMCGIALVAGAAAGLLLPSTRQEDQWMGEASDKLTGRVKSAGQRFFRQTRSVAGRAIQEAVDTTSKELEREGLSPGRLGRKVKRIVGHVRNAVSDAVND